MLLENKRVTLILEPLSKRINLDYGSLVYSALLALNFPITALCAGKGACGKCLIHILESDHKISEPTDKEKKVLGNEKIENGYRLACQTQIFGDLRVYLTDSILPRGARILVDSDLESLGINKESKIQGKAWDSYYNTASP